MVVYPISEIPPRAIRNFLGRNVDPNAKKQMKVSMARYTITFPQSDSMRIDGPA
jgi:hypothetical protein